MQKKTLFFLFKFISIFLILSLLFKIQFIDNLFINLFLIVSKGFVTIFFPSSAQIINTLIIIDKVNLEMTTECTGTPMYALFAAFGLAYHCKDKKSRIRHVALGLLMLFSLNVVRILALIVAASISHSALDFLHDFLWPSTFFVFTLVAALYLIKRCKN
jgi:exosortase/archaeosortase family protein